MNFFGKDKFSIDKKKILLFFSKYFELEIKEKSEK